MSMSAAAAARRLKLELVAGGNDNNDDDVYDEDEYETDTDVDDDDVMSDEDQDDDDSDDEDEQWSLRVRLLSAVDLPPSLSPSVPLCPWFTLGLVEDVNAALDKAAAMELEQQQQHEDEEEVKQEHDRQSIMMSTSTTTDDDDERYAGDATYDEKGDASSTIKVKHSEEKQQSQECPPVVASTSHDQKREVVHSNNKPSSSSSSNKKKFTNTTSRLLSTLTPQYARTSTSKIMARNANGGGGNGADWNEEYRWDGLHSPMESYLLVKLNTRLLAGPSLSSSSTTSESKRGGEQQHQRQQQYPQHYDGINIEGGGANNIIRDLWRKGREQLERRAVVHGGGATAQSISASSGHYPREERAATVAQFLMQQQSPTYQHQQQQHQREGGRSIDGLIGESDIAIQSELPDVDLNNDDSSDFNNIHRTTASKVNQEGLCLGTLAIPLSRLPLMDALLGNKSKIAAANDVTIIEQWYQLDDPNLSKRLGLHGSTIDGGAAHGGGSVGSSIHGKYDDDDDDEPTLLHGPRRCPSVLLEITFASSDYLDEAENNVLMENSDIDGAYPSAAVSSPIPHQQRKDEKERKAMKNESDEKATTKKKDEPELEPGIIDYVCIVGARDIGNQRNDDGSKGWVQSTPECCVLERFPPTDEFHYSNGRKVGLVPQIEWFCFPEGCKLWRGVEAPNHAELVKGGVSVASSMTTSSDVTRMLNSAKNKNFTTSADGSGGLQYDHVDNYERTKFDKVLGTTSSFSWFVLSSNSDVYGSRLVKTYGIVIRFYVPSPRGIDPTQDDFGQTMAGGLVTTGRKDDNKKRLWVPVGICMTTTIP